MIPERGRSKQAINVTEIWDILVFSCIITSAYYVPFSVALSNRMDNSEKLLTRILDMVFIADLFLQFFIAVPTTTSESVYQYEKRPSRILLRYCGLPFGGEGSGWFWIDFASIAPVWLPFLFFFINVDPNRGCTQQALRLICLLRMLRLLRVMRLVDRWNVEFGMSRLGQESLKFFFIISCTVHWFACAWLMIEGRVLVHSGSGAWLEEGKNSWLSALIAAKGDTCNPDADHDPFCVYSIALYWSTMTLTTVGYGDVIPQNEFEYFACTLCMLMSGIIWAYIVGCILSLLTNLDPHGMDYKLKMDQLNELMHEKNLEQSLRVRLRRYMNESRDLPKALGHIDLLESVISIGLQREVASRSLNMLNSIFWTYGLEDNVKNEMVRRLRPKFFGPQELVQLLDTMMIIQKGIMAAKGRILGPGDAWGHESILFENVLLKETATPNTLSYVSVATLTKFDILEIRALFPAAERRLRRAQVRLAALRWCLVMGIQQFAARESRKTKRMQLANAAAHHDGETPPHRRARSNSLDSFAAQNSASSAMDLQHRMAKLELNLSRSQEDLGQQMAGVLRQLTTLNDSIHASSRSFELPPSPSPRRI
eukprot:TRINITY_DN13998_c0_g1_i1.p1 TRINITY_DN13998_c0_g1~~TRINITY_DN13998_c0_g1_i1.p1  ORF type:complete len:699 (-),score=89.58 TRINITY_DN13998_c0_g1_i1:182-1969(-)